MWSLGSTLANSCWLCLLYQLRENTVQAMFAPSHGELSAWTCTQTVARQRTVCIVCVCFYVSCSNRFSECHFFIRLSPVKPFGYRGKYHIQSGNDDYAKQCPEQHTTK